MFYSAYRKMFWGFIFVYIHINIGPIDILPNFAGYIMVYSALRKLAKQEELYNKGRIPALIMSLVSLLDLVSLGDVNLLTSSLNSHEMWIIMLKQLPSIVNLYMVFCICRGFYTVAENMDLEEFKELVKSRWRVFLVTSLFTLFMTPFMFSLSDRWQPLMIIVMIAYFIASILFTALVYRAKNVLAGEKV